MTRPLPHWTRTPAASALLSSIAATPPALVTTRLESHEQWTRDEWDRRYDRNDERVEQLRQLRNEAFNEAERTGGREACLRFSAGMDLDDVIAAVVAAAGRRAAA